MGLEEFRDVDVAVCLSDTAARSVDAVEDEISLSMKIEKALGLPLDVKILNHAPSTARRTS